MFHNISQINIDIFIIFAINLFESECAKWSWERSGQVISWPHSQGQHVRSGQEKWRKNRLARMISNIYTVVLVKNEWEWMRMNENEWEWMRSENEWMKEREWMDGWMDITRLPVIFIFYLFVLQTYFELSLNFLNRLFAISFCIN